MSYNGAFNFPSQTKLLVRGYDDTLAVDDLWQMFSLYGEVSNIIIEGHGATITFKDHCSFPGLESYVEMEMIIGDRKVLVTNVSLMDVSPPLYQEEYPDYYPPPSYTMYPMFYPQHPPPLSPHYDAAILDVGQPNGSFYPQLHPFSVPPPPIVKNQTNVFSFEAPVTEAAKTENQTSKTSSSGGCHVCSNSNKLQPLTPQTPSYQPPPTFSVPPPLPQYWSSMTPPPPPSFQLPPVQTQASSTLLTLSGSTILSTDSSTCMLPIGSEGQAGKQEEKSAKVAFQYFTSPYKKFSKFQLQQSFH